VRFLAPAGLTASIALTMMVGAIGCATARARPSSEVRRRNDIEVAEIRSAPNRLLTAADIVRVLRPEMLTSRDRTSSRTTVGATNAIQVYVDGIPNGGYETLASVPASAVARLQRLTPVEASSRYGGSHPGGVILVTTVASAARP